MAESLINRRAIPEGAQVTRWHAPDGWELRCFAWDAPRGAPARGSILFQGGRGDIFEKYIEAFHHWHDQGWTITSFDWRGQGGSGRLARNCGHIEDYAAYVDDLHAFFREWQAATPAPHVVIAHSMGGHLVLRAMVEHAIRPDAAVLVAPMLGLKSPISAGFGEWLAKTLGGVGNSARPAWRDNEKPYTKTARNQLLTHDEARYADEIWWHGAHPEIFTGPPSWRWLIEGFRSTRELRANPGLRTMDVPVLALVAEADGLVDPKAALATVAKLPDARIVRFGRESAHEILREADPVRNRAIGEIDLFLQSRAQRR